MQDSTDIELSSSVLLQLLGTIVCEPGNSSTYSNSKLIADDCGTDGVLETMRNLSDSDNSLIFSCKLVT